MMREASLSRRELLARFGSISLGVISLGALGACGSGRAAGGASASIATSTTAQDAGGWEALWDRTLTAAKQEGTVSVIAAAGDWPRPFYDVFQKKYGITVDLLQISSQAQLVPKIDVERKANQYNWDVAVMPPQNLFNGLKGINALDPLQPALILPDVLDDSYWLKGFDDGWSDSDKSLVYSFMIQLTWGVRVNRSIVPEAQLNAFDQLWDPKWKGKMAWQDPSLLLSGIGPAGAIYKYKGEAALRFMLKDQQPGITQDQRQLAEWLIRGQYPISIGLNTTSLATLERQGVDIKNIQILKDDNPAAAQRSAGGGGVSLFSRAPHPNAAKVLINWLLTQEAGELFGKYTVANSRRLDVPPLDPDGVLDPKRETLDTTSESDYKNVILKAQAVAREAGK